MSDTKYLCFFGTPFLFSVLSFLVFGSIALLIEWSAVVFFGLIASTVSAGIFGIALGIARVSLQ